jgi:hypothetical protein
LTKILIDVTRCLNIGKITVYHPEFHSNWNFTSKMEKVAIDPNKVSKICKVAILLAFSVLPYGNYNMCTARVLFGQHLTKNGLIFI